mgnify:CR=1 FL=1
MKYGTFDEWVTKFPWDELPYDWESNNKVQQQLTLTYPKPLRENRTGDFIEFWNDGVNTFHETSGAYQNAGVFVIYNKLFTDQELYEYAVETFHRYLTDTWDD